MATILIVDDDAGLCTALSKIIERAGHDVLTAGDGLEAIRVLEAQAVDLAFVDLVMPNMDGVTLLTHIHNGFPQTKVVTMSAYEDVADLPERHHPLARRLGKPFELEEIKAVLDQIL